MVISIRDLHRTYGEVEAVAGIDFDVHRGETVCLLGPNGAGKTTTIEILEGLRNRDVGDVMVLGRDPWHGDARWRSRIGGVMQTRSALQELTVTELLTIHAACHPAPLPLATVLAACQLEDLVKRRVRALSGGQQRRLDLALAIVGNPEVLFLDEPTTGLDPEARLQVWDLVRAIAARGTAIVLSTHHLEEAEALADRVLIMRQGRVVADGTPAQLVASFTGPTVVRFRRDLAVLEPLPTLDGARVRTQHDLVTIETDTPTAILTTLSSWAATSGRSELAELTVSRPNLEHAYLGLVGEA